MSWSRSPREVNHVGASTAAGIQYFVFKDLGECSGAGCQFAWLFRSARYIGDLFLRNPLIMVERLTRDPFIVIENQGDYRLQAQAYLQSPTMKPLQNVESSTIIVSRIHPSMSTNRVSF